MNPSKRIVLLAGNGPSTRIVYHALKSEFEIAAVILEKPVSRIRFIRNRIKKLGLWKVTGQILFQFIIVPYLVLVSGKRKRSILAQYKLTDSPIPSEKIIPVISVNNDQCREQLIRLNPYLVVVNGTRIISKKTLNCLPVYFINMHAGITPTYRGVHGAYWALAKKDLQHCGVTIHLVDPGIDTGDILFQETISPQPQDNFVTYPLLQLAIGIPLMKKAINNLLTNKILIIKGPEQSILWYHPTFRQYIRQRIKGIK